MRAPTYFATMVGSEGPWTVPPPDPLSPPPPLPSPLPLPELVFPFPLPLPFPPPLPLPVSPPAVWVTVAVPVPEAVGKEPTLPTPESGVELGEVKLMQPLEPLPILWTSVLPPFPAPLPSPATKKNCVPLQTLIVQLNPSPPFACDAALRSNDWP
jgi:hypothetical protein